MRVGKVCRNIAEVRDTVFFLSDEDEQYSSCGIQHQFSCVAYNIIDIPDKKKTMTRLKLKGFEDFVKPKTIGVYCSSFVR